MRSRGSRWLPAGIHIAGLLLVVGAAQAAPTVAQKCQPGKNIAAGKYSDCGRDPGVGTIENTRTGLTWEKQSWDSSVDAHDLVYTWAGALAKIAALNVAAFAGFSDWRLPNRAELDSLVSSATAYPAVDPSFNASCAPGCTALACSCTSSDRYWTSTTFGPVPGFAWDVEFGLDQVSADFKTETLHARAVRGGS